MIVGDGSAPIENATIVVTGGRIAQVGPAGKVTVPAGAARVSLTGKTVMPTIVDTHVHLSTTRDPLVADLRRRAYFGVSAAMSLGLDPPGDPFQVRATPPAGAARYFTAGRGITMPEQGRTDVPYWVNERGRRAQGGAGTGGAQGRLHQDLGRRPRRQVPEDAAATSTPR